MYLSLKTEITWIPTDNYKNLPPYETKVLVVRPNPVTGEDDILIGRLRRAEQEGTMYGKLGSERRTYDDFWLVPRVMVLEKITYFAYLPNPPKRTRDRYK